MIATRDPHLSSLEAAAAARGIEYRDLFDAWGVDGGVFSRDGASQMVLKGRVFGSLNATAERICDDKRLTKKVLGELGIPHPEGVWFRDPAADEAVISSFLVEGRAHVCKPVDGTEGRGVRTDVTSRDALAAYWTSWRQEFEAFLLEELVEGEDLRIQAIGGELVAACTRRPAHLTGDGTRTVEALIEDRREEMATQNPQNALEIDADAQAWLDQQGFGLGDVPPAGQEVRLKSISNMSVGGVAVDVTDALHAGYGEWVRKIAERLGIQIFALDVIATDPSLDPSHGAKIVEINARPQWLHHTFSERRTHDVPGMILDLLFGGSERPAGP